MTEVKVRPAVWEDRRAIAKLIAAMGSHENVLLSKDPLRSLGAILNEPTARVLVAELEGRVIGYAELQARPSSLHDAVEGWLGALAVDPSLRGSGVGAQLMASIEHEAQLLGCEEIVLESSSWRNMSHAFYRKIGFRQETSAERFRRAALPTSSAESRFLGVAARAANNVIAALAPWVGVQTQGKDADVQAEAAALEVLEELGLPVLAEEGGWSRAPTGNERWVCLDPLDGSRNMRAGLPPWAFSAALIEDERSIAGFVSDLSSGRRWWAERGGGAWVDGRAAQPRRLAMVGIGSRPDTPAGLPAWVERTRIIGSSAIELCHVADGSLGGYFGLGGVTIFPQDVAAALVILEEAGACVIDIEQSSPRIQPNREQRLQVVAAPGLVTARELLASGVVPETHT